MFCPGLLPWVSCAGTTEVTVARIHAAIPEASCEAGRSVARTLPMEIPTLTPFPQESLAVDDEPAAQKHLFR